MLDAFLLARPLLFELAAAVHPERLAAAGAGGAKELFLSPRAVSLLSRDLSWLGETRELPLDGWWEFLLEPSAGPSLWDGGALWRVGMRFGAGLHRKEVAALVRRPAIDRFWQEIGRDAHGFALRQAPLLFHNFRPEDRHPAAGELTERIRAAGARGLACWLSRLPEGLAGRVRLKLPPEVDVRIAEVGGWPEEQRADWARLTASIMSNAQCVMRNA